MNKWYSLSVTALLVAAGLMLASVSQADESAAEDGELTLESTAQRASYAIGVSIGRDIQQQDIELDPELIARGLQDAIEEDGEIALSDEELEAALMEMQEEAMAAQTARFEEDAKANLEEGQAFLEANREKDGIQTTESGLQYEVLEEGDGPTPAPDDQVVAHYEGAFLDGEVFDSSYDRGEPITLPVEGVIEGWSEALKMMPVGSKWRLFIPADLAYGEQGTGPIGPNQTLIFEVELQEIASGDGQ